MAVTITDNRTIIHEADSSTGWTSTESITEFTTDPGPVELTHCLGIPVSTTTSYIYYTMGAGVDMSAGMFVFVWVLANGTMDTTANGGITLLLGDGTNRIGFHLAGSDKAVFRHGVGPVGWQCLVLDTTNLPTASTDYEGSRAGLIANLSSITEVGAGFKTLSKALGGSSNCFIDVMRYGNGGITVTGGTVGDPGTFAQLAAEDRSSTNQKAYGIIRELAAGVYGVQGSITWGDNAGTGTFYFKDESAVVVIEDTVWGTGTATDITLKVVGNATAATQHFELGISVGSGDTQSGRSGVQILNANIAYQPLIFDASDVDLDELLLYGCSFIGMQKSGTLALEFSSDATLGPNHKLSGVIFDRCGQIDLGRVVVRNCIFSGFTSNTDGALLWSENINIKNSQFLANTDATNDPAAIEHPGSAGSPYAYDNLKFSGNDYDVNNTSGSAITINLVNGSDASTSKGSSVSFISAYNLQVNVKDVNNTPLQYVQVAVFAVDNDEPLMNEETNASGEAQESYAGSIPRPIYTRVRESSSGETRYFPFSTNQTINGDFVLDVTLTEDLVASS